MGDPRSTVMVPPVPAVGDPGDDLLADRGHLLSRLTFACENHHRAGPMGHFRTATLVDSGRCRMPFGLRNRSGLANTIPTLMDPSGVVAEPSPD
jgi:hypothetical protein